MAYFEPDFLDFFKELAANNNKDWFDEHRKRYHRVVKEPFKAYVSDVIAAVHKRDAKVTIAPKDAIFRINRDIRFAKDKTPYKLQVSAIISRTGKKDKAYPGLYVQFDPEHVRFYGGVYRLSPQQTADMRFGIAEHPEIFKKLIGAPAFKKTYGKVHGEQAKRIPKELRAAAEKQPLLFNKSMYFFASHPPETVLRDDLIDITLAHYETARPMTQFLERHIYG